MNENSAHRRCGIYRIHVARELCERGDEVIGIDNLNDYYDVELKHARLRQLEPLEKFRFIKMDISNRAEVENLFSEQKFQRVIHLAAQAGVRYSLENQLLEQVCIGLAHS